MAKSELHWFKPFDKVLQWDEPVASWFVGGKTNVSYNCLDVHLGTPRQNKAALIWEGEPGDQRTLTYQQLHREVCKFANVLLGLGVGEGDVVILKALKPPKMTDFRALLDQAQTSAEEAGLSPDDVEHAIREARGKA